MTDFFASSCAYRWCGVSWRNTEQYHLLGVASLIFVEEDITGSPSQRHLLSSLCVPSHPVMEKMSHKEEIPGSQLVCLLLLLYQRKKMHKEYQYTNTMFLSQNSFYFLHHTVHLVRCQNHF